MRNDNLNLEINGLSGEARCHRATAIDLFKTDGWLHFASKGRGERRGAGPHRLILHTAERERGRDGADTGEGQVVPARYGTHSRGVDPAGLHLVKTSAALQSQPGVPNIMMNLKPLWDVIQINDPLETPTPRKDVCECRRCL